MKYMLILVIVFLVLTIFLLNEDYKKGNLSKKSFLLVGIMEGVSAIVLITLFFVL